MKKKDQNYPNHESNVVSGEDIAYLLGENHTYTWDEFYAMMEMERANGVSHCPQASYIALELLKPQIMRLPWRSINTNSETYKDIINDAYLVISEKIKSFDPSQSAFKTYIMKWFAALARETRNDGISEYQRRQGYVVLSSDAEQPSSLNDTGNASGMEFIDEHSSIDDIMDKKERARTNELLCQILGYDESMEDEQDKTDIYMNTTCYHRFLGGIRNLSDGIREELASVISEHSDRGE